MKYDVETKFGFEHEKKQKKIIILIIK